MNKSEFMEFSDLFDSKVKQNIRDNGRFIKKDSIFSYDNKMSFVAKVSMNPNFSKLFGDGYKEVPQHYFQIGQTGYLGHDEMDHILATLSAKSLSRPVRELVKEAPTVQREGRIPNNKLDALSMLFGA